MILRLSICIHIIVKHLLLILLLHLMTGGTTPATDGHQVVVLLVVVALSLIVLHLEQIVVLLLRIAIGVGDDRLSLCGLLLLLDHVEALALGARGLQGRQLVHGSPHIVLDGVLLWEGGQLLLLLGELVRVLLTSHLWGVVTMNNGILLKLEKVVILFGVNEVAAIILFDDGLLMIALIIVRDGRNLVVDESLPLKEVLPPLLLLNQLLRLAIARL